MAHDLTGSVPPFGIVVNNGSLVIPDHDDVALFHKCRYHQAVCRREETGYIAMVLLPTDKIKLNRAAFVEVFVCRNRAHQAIDEDSA